MEIQMSTKATLAHRNVDGDEPNWHLYEEVFEAGVVYLQLEGVEIEVSTLDRRRDSSGVALVVRLPMATATQLGLSSIVPPERWVRACEREKSGGIRQWAEAFGQRRDELGSGDDRTESDPEEP
jgi:hypothetical protein